MTRRVLPRLIALLTIVIAGGYYILVDIVQIRIGPADLHVTVDLRQASGIFATSAVTYNGVQVGKVASVQLEQTGVAAHLDLDPGTRIPANARATIHQMSALGEQYIDLVPTSAQGPDLTDGSVIPVGRTTLPIAINTTLANLGALADSVNQQDLHTDETFLSQGFGGTGPGLRQIVVTGQELTNALIAAQAGTADLLLNGVSVLQTVDASDADLAQLISGLDQFTGQLQASDASLRGVLANGSSALGVTAPVLRTDGQAIEATLGGLAASVNAAATNAAGVRALFALLPSATSELASIEHGGSLHGNLAINTSHTVCQYTPGAATPAPTRPVATPALSNSCPFTAPDLDVRGAPAP